MIKRADLPLIADRLISSAGWVLLVGVAVQSGFAARLLVFLELLNQRDPAHLWAFIVTCAILVAIGRFGWGATSPPAP